MIGLLFRIWPWLGDVAIAPMPSYMPPVIEPVGHGIPTPRHDTMS
jgi:hypothetical protein